MEEKSVASKEEIKLPRINSPGKTLDYLESPAENCRIGFNNRRENFENIGLCHIVKCILPGLINRDKKEGVILEAYKKCFNCDGKSPAVYSYFNELLKYSQKHI